MVTQETQNIFNVEKAVEEQSAAVFATILDLHYHQLKFLSDQIKAHFYRETFTIVETLTAAEDCQILELLEVSQATSQEMVSQPPKRKRRQH